MVHIFDIRHKVGLPCLPLAHCSFWYIWTMCLVHGLCVSIVLMAFLVLGLPRLGPGPSPDLSPGSFPGPSLKPCPDPSPGGHAIHRSCIRQTFARAAGQSTVGEFRHAQAVDGIPSRWTPSICDPLQVLSHVSSLNGRLGHASNKRGGSEGCGFHLQRCFPYHWRKLRLHAEGCIDY